MIKENYSKIKRSLVSIFQKIKILSFFWLIIIFLIIKNEIKNEMKSEIKDQIEKNERRKNMDCDIYKTGLYNRKI